MPASLPTDWSPETYTFEGGAWVPIAAGVLAATKADLVADLKLEAEQRKMLVLTAGGAKKYIYAQQYSEVVYYRSLTGVLPAIGLMTAAQIAHFPAAIWSAKKRGETTIVNAIARFEKGANKANPDVFRLEAIEQEGCEAIMAATTVTAARAARAAVNWNWGKA